MTSKQDHRQSLRVACQLWFFLDVLQSNLGAPAALVMLRFVASVRGRRLRVRSGCNNESTIRDAATQALARFCWTMLCLVLLRLCWYRFCWTAAADSDVLVLSEQAGNKVPREDGVEDEVDGGVHLTPLNARHGTPQSRQR